MSIDGFPDTPSEAGLRVQVSNLVRQNAGLERTLRTILASINVSAEMIDEVLAKAKAAA